MPKRWWILLIVLAFGASVNLCLYFFYYAPALAANAYTLP